MRIVTLLAASASLPFALRLHAASKDVPLALHVISITSEGDSFKQSPQLKATGCTQDAQGVTCDTSSQVFTAKRKCQYGANEMNAKLCVIDATLELPKQFPVELTVQGLKSYSDHGLCLHKQSGAVRVSTGRCGQAFSARDAEKHPHILKTATREALDLSNDAHASKLLTAPFSQTTFGGLTLKALLIREPQFLKDKEVLVVRHAESTWNAGQSAASLGGLYSMFSDNDHELSAKGREQAQTLRKQLESLSAPGKVLEHFAPSLTLVSPFTRALETAIIGLPPQHRQNTVLSSTVREKKNAFGKDTVGDKLGAAQFSRAYLAARVGEVPIARVHETPLGAAFASLVPDGWKKSWINAPVDETANGELSAHYEMGDATQQWWWGSTTDKEEKHAVHDRLAELKALIKFSAHQSIALVGHSHNWREFMAELGLSSASPEECALKFVLETDKIGNAGAVLLKLADGHEIQSIQLLEGSVIDRESKATLDCKGLTERCGENWAPDAVFGRYRVEESAEDQRSCALQN